MCRLFGFRSIIPSQVHRSLLAAENALGVQSNEHPDGWGVAFYIEGSPHVTRSPLTAVGDALFHRLSGAVSSQTVLAHVRRATRGEKTVFNCHPFQHGRWVFAHNGDITHFDRRREVLLGEVSPELRRFILGDTDSEVLFFIFLTKLSAIAPSPAQRGLDAALAALRATVQAARELADDAETPSTLTLMATDGEVLVATHGGKSLFVSTHKTRCADRDVCKSLSAACEGPSPNGQVNHFVLSSEPLHGENVWVALEAGEMIGIDGHMRPRRAHVARGVLPLAG
ncbi:MAG TPA: class II glutamine amidotransferase [Polyangiaceae bacterium]|nr:class II glutamine amidotransferase [Polyangiaceae bacterium]